MRSGQRVALFAAKERAIEALPGRAGEAERAIGWQRRLRLGGGRGVGRGRSRREELLEFFEKRLPAGAKFDRAQVPLQVEDAVGESLLVGQSLELSDFRSGCR